MSVEWISVPEYMSRTGLSRVNVNRLIKENRLVHTRTEGNQVRIKMEENTEVIELQKQLKEQSEMLELLCKHLGVRI